MISLHSLFLIICTLSNNYIFAGLFAPQAEILNNLFERTWDSWSSLLVTGIPSYDWLAHNLQHGTAFIYAHG